MLVDFKNICFNTTLNIVRGKESLQQSTFAWGEAFHGSPLAVNMFISSKTFTMAFFPGKKYLPFPIVPFVCVAVHLWGEGTGSKAAQNASLLLEAQAKRSCSELAGSYFLRVMPGRR